MDHPQRIPDARSLLRDILGISGTDGKIEFRAHRDMPLPCNEYQTAGDLVTTLSEKKLEKSLAK